MQIHFPREDIVPRILVLFRAASAAQARASCTRSCFETVIAQSPFHISNSHGNGKFSDSTLWLCMRNIVNTIHDIHIHGVWLDVSFAHGLLPVYRRTVYTGVGHMQAHENMPNKMRYFLASSRNVRNPNAGLLSAAIFYTDTKLEHYLNLFKVKTTIAELQAGFAGDYEQCCNSCALMLHSLLGPMSTSRHALQEMEAQFCLKCLTTVKQIQKRPRLS